MFLNLLYKALKADSSKDRVKAFTKRLLQVTFHSSSSAHVLPQVCEYQPPQLICGLLFLVSELLRAKPEMGSIQQVRAWSLKLTHKKL